MNAITLTLFSQLNYWAIAVTALACFFLGGLWYSPALFEGPWMAANGYSAEQVQQLQSNLGAAGFTATFLSYLMLTSVLAVILRALGVGGISAGMLIGALVWLGFIATTGLAVNLFSLKPLSVWLIDGSFQLVALVMAGAILGAWQ